MKQTAKWTAAIFLSLMVHAGAAIVFLPDDEMPEQDAVAGAASIEVAVLGNAFEETIESGDPIDALEPVDEPVEEAVPPVEPETTQAMAEPIVPPVAETTAEVPPETVPSEADVILPADSEPPVVAEAPEVVASLPPPAIVLPEEKPEPPVKAAETPKRKPAPEKPRKTVERKKAGDEGQSQAQKVRGREDGTASTGAAASDGSKASASREIGNASISNYQGKVRAKVNRILRYPRRAERERVTGKPVVSFTVASNGGVSRVRIQKSSGSTLIDTAAIEAVQRAAPFPKIPDEAGKSTWNFNLPLSFERR